MTQPFYFPNGQLANSAEDLLELCQQHPDEATNYLLREDLEKWLAYVGSYDLAECAVSARQTELEDRQKLEEFLSRSHSVTIAQTVPAAVTETQIKDNLTAPESASSTPDIPQEESVDDSTSAATDLPLTATLTDTTEMPQEESATEPTTATPPERTAESLRTSSTPENSDSTEEKPSFFQVIAKFIVKILYRNKA